MDLTPHMVVGAALTMRMRPWRALVVGIGTHVILDAVPHAHLWIRGATPAALVDLGVAVGLTSVIVWMAPDRWGGVAGTAGSLLPDLERLINDARPEFLERSFGLPHGDTGSLWGYASQVIVVIAAAALAYVRRRRPGGAGAMSARQKTRGSED